MSFKQLAHAVNYVAWWMEDLVGHAEKFPTIAYTGISDLRYGVMMIAAIKAGYTVSVTYRTSGGADCLTDTTTLSS